MIETLTPPIRAVMIDLDGVLWKGSQPIGDLPAIFAEFQARRLDFLLMTNNATRSPEAVQARVAGFGVHIPEEKIISSAMAAAYLLHKSHPKGGPVYIIGEEGLRHSLEKAGFYHAEEDVLAVVAGLDRSFTYEKLRHATALIRGGALFIGSNPDRTFPSPSGLLPGAGSILAALEASTGVQPLIAGKPMPALFEVALEYLGTLPEETLMVGDRLDTDILGAQQVGCRTAVVLSGVTNLAEAQSWHPAPDLIAPSLSHLLNLQAVKEE